ncbi:MULTISPECIES: hypothetical protein [unclassified Burkholderia]|nr:MULTISPECIES: hypothetical protein [unclassified Burkholderia]
MFYAEFTYAKPHLSRTLLTHWHDHYTEYVNGRYVREVPLSAVCWC